MNQLQLTYIAGRKTYVSLPIYCDTKLKTNSHIHTPQYLKIYFSMGRLYFKNTINIEKVYVYNYFTLIYEFLIIKVFFTLC